MREGKALRYGDAFYTQMGKLQAFKEQITDLLWTQKMNNLLGLGTLLAFILPLCLLISKLPLAASVVMVAALIGLPVIVFCVVDLTFAMGFALLWAVMVVFAGKWTSAPIGTLLDLVILLAGVGLLLRQIRERNWDFIKHPMSYIIMAWLYYNILVALNPIAESTLAWLYTVRSVAIQQIVYFITLYAIHNNYKAGIRLLKFIIWICVFACLYGFKQEFFGFSAQETIWVNSDPKRFQLYYQWGRMRIPGICWDPTTYGILMACFTFLCVALALGPFRRNVKIFFWVFAVLSLWVNVYTGTRTAYVMWPVGAVFYAGLVLNRNVVIISVIALMGFTALMLKSTNNKIIFRIQSSFKPTTDESMVLRLDNQAKIQPFIQSHPFGGGLGCVGVWGRRFNPGSELSKFPPDSSFVRMGVELGWIGLILYTLLHYYALRTGLYYYFRCTDPKIRAIYAGIATWMFMLTVACYVQEAILQQPMNVIYNVMLAILVSLKNFDPAFKEAYAAAEEKPKIAQTEPTFAGQSQGDTGLESGLAMDK
jgi:putative inorganic carbon (hco3(-)) transporter